VAVIEANEVAAGITGHTTAKVTAGHGLVYDRLIREAGEERARAYAEAQRDAIALLLSIVRERSIDCDLDRVDHFVYAEPSGDPRAIDAEARAAARLGLPAEHVDDPPLPFPTGGAVRFRDQAQMHPRKYLLPLAAAIPGDGSVLIERRRVMDIQEGEPCVVRAEGLTVRADQVVVATHHPIVDRGMLSTRMVSRRSYVLTAPLEGDALSGTFISTEDPDHALRLAPEDGRRLVVISGEGHETGRVADTAQRYLALERWARERLAIGPIVHRWSVQDNYPLDGRPYVGRLPGGDGRVLVATGFGGWGMTHGTAAGRLLADELTDVETPWAAAYEPKRRPPRGGALRMVGFGIRTARDFLGDRLRRRSRAADELRPGEAAVLEGRSGKLAAYRDESGNLHVVSATCTHLGCIVRWNGAERSWDCPCHGSRFSHTGQVLNTPAVAPLAERSWAVRRR
jgi:glycine/D-amino acid oxidase-like deaminating enzyme/nitrite reductase/ring-hydroxylating ferredoxin subunit